MTNEKRAAARLSVSGKTAMDHVQRRYKPGSKIGSSGVVERVEQVGDCIMIYFRAAANAVATVYGAIHDAFLFNYRCTLVTNVD